LCGCPGILAVITLTDWLKLLRENRFSVDSAYLLRAVAISFAADMNSVKEGLFADLLDGVRFAVTVDKSAAPGAVVAPGAPVRSKYASHQEIVFPELSAIRNEVLFRCYPELVPAETSRSGEEG